MNDRFRDSNGLVASQRECPELAESRGGGEVFGAAEIASSRTGAFVPEGVIRGSRYFVSRVPHSGHGPDTALNSRLTMVL
jgi:hypothetical protein